MTQTNENKRKKNKGIHKNERMEVMKEKMKENRKSFKKTSQYSKK